MKLDKADILFSKYIRTRDKWTCQRCRKQYPEKAQGLHCSHYWSRKNENVRFDPDNCCTLCYYCHMYWGHGDGRDEYREFMIKRLGEKGFKDLELRKNLYCKKDRAMSYLYVKKLMDDLKTN